MNNSTTLCQVVDIETWSTSTTAAIASIGACRIDINSGIIDNEFYINVSKKTCDQVGLDTQQSTVDWWKKQDRKVLLDLTQNTVSITTALAEFFKWHNPDQELWCHGLNFDAPIIQYAAVKTGWLEMPWKYYNLRCSRTLAAAFNVNPMAYRKKGQHHNALEDAKSQALMIYHIKKPLLDAMSTGK